MLALWTLVGLSDLVARRVPNALLLSAMALQVILLLAGHRPMTASSETWGVAITGFVLAFAVFVPVWRIGKMGAGDVKFLAVLGLSLGPIGLVASWLVASVLAGVHGLVVLSVAKRVRLDVYLSWFGARFHRATKSVNGWVAPVKAWLALRRGTRKGTPYATYLAIGAITWVLVLSRQ